MVCGIFPTKDQTHVPCIGSSVLDHWTTWEVHNSMYKWHHMVYVFFFLTSLSVTVSRSTHPCCCKWHYFIAFYTWVVFHCVYIPHLYPFIIWWTFRCLGYCKQCWYEVGVGGVFFTLEFSWHICLGVGLLKVPTLNWQTIMVQLAFLMYPALFMATNSLSLEMHILL